MNETKTQTGGSKEAELRERRQAAKQSAVEVEIVEERKRFPLHLQPWRYKELFEITRLFPQVRRIADKKSPDR